MQKGRDEREPLTHAKAGVEKVLRDPVTAMEALTEHSKSIPSDVKYARRPFVLWAPFFDGLA